MQVQKFNFLSVIKSIDYLRWTALATIIWFVLVFNVERVSIDGESVANLSNIIYGTLAVLGLATLAFPNITTINPVVLLISIVTVQQFIYVVALEQAFNTETLITDSILVGITLLLLRRLGHFLLDTENSLNDYMLIDENSHILPYEVARQRANEELIQFNKPDQAMALIYCRVYSDDTYLAKMSTLEDVLEHHMNETFLARYLQVKLGRFIQSLTYTTDIICEYGYGIVVCLFETNVEDANKFLHQLNAFIKTSENLTLWTGTAFFSEDGANFDDLLSSAKQGMNIYVPKDTMEDDVVRVGDVSVSITDRLRIESDASWVGKLAYQSSTARAIYRPIKRIMDIAGATILLVAISPVLIVLAIAILLDDGWPIFYSHRRVGLGGKTFKMHKFRSMYNNAPPLEPVIVRLSDGTIRYDWPEKDEDDPRITRTGRILRKFSLDELPQFWNVLTGSMSLIGPRPSSWTLDQHTLHQTARLTVKPGITGLWQVSARDSKNFDERLLWDLKYVEKMGLWLDIQILLRTLGAVIKRSGV